MNVGQDLEEKVWKWRTLWKRIETFAVKVKQEKEEATEGSVSQQLDVPPPCPNFTNFDREWGGE